MVIVTTVMWIVYTEILQNDVVVCTKVGLGYTSNGKHSTGHGEIIITKAGNTNYSISSGTVIIAIPNGLCYTTDDTRKFNQAT
jgi:hypothetical protein